MALLPLLYVYALPITVNFPVAIVENQVITYLDLKAECELEVLLYGGEEKCTDKESLRKTLEDVIVRKIVTLTTFELRLYLVRFDEVEDLYKRLQSKSSKRLEEYRKTYGLTTQQVEYMLWERLNTIRYLQVRFGEDFNPSDRIFKTWLETKTSAYGVKNLWDKTGEKIFKNR